MRLEALAVDNGGAALVVLLLGDPHLLEGGEGSQDGASDPDGVLPLWGSDDLDLDVTDNLPLGSGGEGVAPLGEDLHQVVGELTASQVKTDDGVGESVTLVHGDT